MESSHLASFHIAKAGKPHSTGQNLILPVVKDIVKIMFGEKEAKQSDLIPMSNGTVHRRINEMASDVENQLIVAIIYSRFFALQIDESTDIVNSSHLFH